ncbi:cellular tumor antigen p53-like isoform X10 [Macrobrachium nipponense]|uniref:cellular tumor antigen p53-like isoform X10 n=1 Tax=Macrobrachium nipponense TaxID=159736 RepID=UPI0030C7F046
MRFKKAPLKAPGGESSDIIIKEEFESYSDVTNEEMPNTTHAEESSHLGGLGRPLVQGVSGILPALQPARTPESYLNKDEETQAAQAKLRQYEALGLIKVEVDEGPRAVSEISVPLYAVPQSTAVVIPQQQQTFTAAKTGGVVDVPALTDMEGDYGFSVTIEEKERTTKSPMWLMSSVTNKLYTNINKAVPFEIQLRKKVPSDKSFYIRAVAVFSSAQFLRTNVTRCPNHASTADMTNHVKVNGMVVSTGFPYPTHVVRADHPEAKYEESLTGRLSVVVPLDKLVDGSDFTPILLRFMCLGSCVGGINRRPIAIILTLENGLGQVFGRKVIDVRVCACPTRDIRTDELALSNKGGKRRGSSHQEKTLPPPRKKPKVEPKVEPQDDDNKLFTIVVRGRKLYDFLTLVKESYLKTHPECADRYHDPSFQNEDSSEDEVKNSNSSQGLEAGDSDSVSWDSGCNFTQQVGVGSVMILR